MQTVPCPGEDELSITVCDPRLYESGSDCMKMTT